MLIIQKHYSPWVKSPADRFGRSGEERMALGEDNMKKMRLRDLPDWPPQPGGAYDSSWRFPTAGEAVVNQLFPLQNERLTFRGQFEGHPHSYHYKAATEKIASQIHTIVAANMGKTVAELGEFEIDER